VAAYPSPFLHSLKFSRCGFLDVCPPFPPPSTLLPPSGEHGVWPGPQSGGRYHGGCREGGGGQADGEFPLVIWQTGSGTQSNMNANEVQ